MDNDAAERRQEIAGAVDTHGDSPALHEELLQQLRKLSHEPDRAAARAAARAALANSRNWMISGQLRFRRAAYALLEELEDGGSVNGSSARARIPPIAVVQINELVRYAGLPAAVRTIILDYANIWPNHPALSKWGRMAIRMDCARADFHDDETADVQILRRDGARSVIIVFCGINHGFGISLTALHKFWLSSLNAHVIFLRDFSNCLYIGGIKSIGNHTATLDRIRQIIKELDAEHIATIGFSLGNFGALYYGALLPADRVVAFAGPTSLDIGLQFPNKLSYKVAHARHLAGEVPWPDIRAMLAEHPSVKVRCFYSEGNRADALQARHLLGLQNVEVLGIPDSDAHFTLDALDANGLLEGILREAAGER